MTDIRPASRSTSALSVPAAAPGAAAPAQATQTRTVQSPAAGAQDGFSTARPAVAPAASDEAVRDAGMEMRIARRLGAADTALSEGTQDLLDTSFRAVERTLGRPAALELGAAAALGFMVAAVPTALVVGTVGAAVNGIMGGLPEKYFNRLADQMDGAKPER